MVLFKEYNEKPLSGERGRRFNTQLRHFKGVKMLLVATFIGNKYHLKKPDDKHYLHLSLEDRLENRQSNNNNNNNNNIFIV